MAQIGGIVASTLCARISRDQRDVPPPQATLNGRSLWVRTVAQDWAEERDRSPSRRRDAAVPPRIHWLLDSVTMSAASVRNGRLDVIAHNALGRALHAPMSDSPTTDKSGRPNSARYHFLDWDARGGHRRSAACRGRA
ncbi:hypothetical protein GCM10010415_66120 [Streptomyces atrovirens]|uniref:MmyB-like transcription regulator ligand binding domain-containing protein n=1 Tax=Streptomyces atrovirens TaxID=285556 RepID=A0ABW0DMF8_9ACTN